MTLRSSHVLGIVACLLFVPTVAGHANYLSSEPARGARLSAAPDSVTVVLSEELDPKGSRLEVRDAAGGRIDEGDVRIQPGERPVLSVDLRDGVGPGAYTIVWKALSTVDGHVTSGTVGFAVGGFEPPPPTDPTSSLGGVSPAARAATYAGYALVFGVVAFLLWIEREPTYPGRAGTLRRILLLGSVLILTGVAVLALHTADATGLGIANFFTTGVGRTFGLRIAAAVLTVVAAAIAQRIGGRPSVMAVGGLGLIDAAGSSLFVHSANQGWPAIAVDFLHLVAAATWLGALGLFLQFIRHAATTGTYDDVRRVGQRFSPVALGAVTLLGATGIASTAYILGSAALLRPVELLDHPYGGVLAAKIALFGLMVAIASVNRFVFLGTRPGPDRGIERRPRILRFLFPKEGPSRHRAFARIVALEAGLGVVVLVLAGSLTAISPPTTPEIPEDATRTTGFGQEFRSVLTLRPAPIVGAASNVSFELSRIADGRPVEAAVRIRVSVAAADDVAAGGQAWTATHVAGGHWTIGEVLFTQKGPHTVRLEVQTDDVYRDIVDLRVDVRDAPTSA